MSRYQFEDRWGNMQPAVIAQGGWGQRMTPARCGDHTMMMLSANDMEAVLGNEVLNGIETVESRTRKLCLDAIANGTDLLAWFRRFDVNRDGNITKAELLEGLVSMGLELTEFLDANLTGLAMQEELDLFMKKIDRGIFQNERDNKIDYQEFVKFIMSEGEFAGETMTAGIHRPIELLHNRGVKLVGLFFGQSWNPSFNKALQKVTLFYNALKSHGENRFEIVYVSLDQTQAHFTDKYRKMPWLAIPFHQRERRHFLAKKYFVTSTPRLVLTDMHGNLLSYDVKVNSLA